MWSQLNFGLKVHMSDSTIQVRGASEHNLKTIDLDLPKNKLITFKEFMNLPVSSM